MPVRKMSASAYLLNPKAGRSVGARKQQYSINGYTVDEALYVARQAARPAIVRYVRGKGPRPDDPSMWFTAQDRDILRRLHAKGLAYDDPRYFDALFEAAIAGDRLSKKETKHLAEHARVMDDGVYLASRNRASELSAEAQALGHRVFTSEKKEKGRLAGIHKGNEEKLTLARARQRHITEEVSIYKSITESKLTIHGIVETLCRKSTQRHPTVDDGYVFPHKNVKMENENLGGGTLSSRRLNDYVSRALVANEIARSLPTLPTEQQTPDYIANRLCQGGEGWSYNGVQSIKKTTLKKHLKKLLTLKPTDR